MKKRIAFALVLALALQAVAMGGCGKDGPEELVGNKVDTQGEAAQGSSSDFASGEATQAGQSGDASGEATQASSSGDTLSTDGTIRIDLPDDASQDGQAADAWQGAEVDVPRTAVADAVTDFSLRLFQECQKGEQNALVSPMSVLCALAMTANGAGGDTLSQMEEAFGFPMDQLNAYLSDYVANLPDGEGHELKSANSIWIREDLAENVHQEFLDKNATYYDAQVYKEAFDEGLADEVNEWVNERTGGMVPKILEDDPAPNTVMYLINALSFDAEWRKIYEETQVQEGSFTQEDGTETDVEFMSSEEHAYLKDDHAEGFLKYYKDGSYAFAALLPEEGMTVSEYVESLTGERLSEILSSASNDLVYAKIPKFRSSCQTVLNEDLEQLGITDLFEGGLADLSGISDGLYVDSVVHASAIEVNEKGTKAGAATAVEVKEMGMAIPGTPHEVYLDRPFLYLLIDCEENQPLFIGVLDSPELAVCGFPDLEAD